MIKEFLKNLKQYLSYLMKVDFVDLFIQFIILVIILILSLFVYVPVALVQDVVYSAIRTFGTMTDGIYSSVDLISKIVGCTGAIFAFMYLFNKRYDDVKKMEEELKKEQNSSDKKKQDKPKNPVKEEIDLPKEK